ncbi:unnamed protein product [Tuber melanosporum]|uniref:(Perigord truffle) hypothetical protein n=1 Tax=Tuber melanosporum (strain Mel28) TaxID=656061 RepID=D5GKS3_TUBMM|nr:uncharacterized protein GSTUM_00009739001 [Tuber melanosporum]CAZ85116.1 unnamed protein product [Tuber melanosporum]
MTVLETSQRLASLTDTHKECMSLISRLSKLDTPGGDSTRTELANVIHQSLRDAESELELLSAQVEDEVGDGAQAALKGKVVKAGEDLKIARLQYRKAQLSTKRNALAAEQREREALLSGSGRSTTPDGIAGKRKGNQKLSQNDLLLHASTDVTTALRRTHTLLQSELSRSQFAAETLNTSTAALQDLTHRYSAFDDVISSSRALISDLVRKNKSDRWYYKRAIEILLGLLMWLIVRRLLWGPIYLVLVVPFQITWWGLSLVTGALGVGGRRDIMEDAGMGMGGATTVQDVGIPESMLGTKSPERSATSLSGEGEGEKSMREQVERIIDGEPEVEVERVEMEKAEPVGRNTKSRSREYGIGEEEVEMEKAEPVRGNTKSGSMEYDPGEGGGAWEEGLPETHDEL